MKMLKGANRKRKAIRGVVAALMSAVIVIASGAEAVGVRASEKRTESAISEAGKTSRISGGIIDLKPGDTKKLKVEAARITKWSSDNKTVAKVNKKGKVKAMKPGIATITGKAGKEEYCFLVAVNSRSQSDTEDEGFRKMAEYIKKKGEYFAEEELYKFQVEVPMEEVREDERGKIVLSLEYADYGGALDKLCARVWYIYLDFDYYSDQSIAWTKGDNIARYKEIKNLDGDCECGEGRIDKSGFTKDTCLMVYIDNPIWDDAIVDRTGHLNLLMSGVGFFVVKAAGLTWSDLGFTSYE